MDVKIYTVDYCPYCKAALKFLTDKGIKFEQIKIDDNEIEMREKIGREYNIKGDVTVPQIIIDGKRIGGYTDMMSQYENGELKF